MIAPTHMRIDSLFFGVMLAYFYHLHPHSLARVAKHRWLLIILGLALISPMAFIDQLNSPMVWTVGFTMLYVGYGCILWPSSIPSRVTACSDGRCEARLPPSSRGSACSAIRSISGNPKSPSSSQSG
jgi:hypothetical protein